MIGENRDRIVDALNSARSAMSDGVICGGGTAFVHASHLLDELDFGDTDKNFGKDILKKAIRV